MKIISIIYIDIDIKREVNIYIRFQLFFYNFYSKKNVLILLILY